MIGHLPPHGWGEARLDEVAEVVTVTTPATTRPDFYGGEIPFVRPPDLDASDPITDASIRITAAGAEGSRVLPAGAVLVCCIGSLGKVGFAGVPVATNQQINALVFDRRNVEPRYGYHFCRTLKPLLEHMAPATTVAIVNKTKFSQLRIPLPHPDDPKRSLTEQKRIAAVLDKADAIRRRRQKAARLADQLIPCLFYDMFGSPTANSRKWPRRPLGEITLIDAPMVDPRLDEYCDLRHYGADRIDRDTGRLLPAKTAREDGLISGKFLFDDRYVLYSKIRPNLRKVALGEQQALCSADVYPVRPRADILTREFLWALLLTPEFTEFAIKQSGRANIPKINREQFARYDCVVPPLPMQEQFSSRSKHVLTLTSEQANNEHEADNLFNSLVQRAFRGEL